MKKIHTALASFLLFITATSFSQNKAVDLKFNLPMGSGFDYNTTMDVTTKGNVGGQDINVNNSIVIGYHFNVVDDSAGWNKMTSTISKIAMTISSNGMNMNYDSDKPLDTSNVMNGAFGNVLGVMKGAQFGFTMNNKGDIGSVTGINEILDKMKTAAPGGDMTGMASTFNEETFRQTLRQAFSLYPRKRVKSGDRWTSTTHTISAGVQMKMDNAYTLESVTGNIARVKVDSKISSPLDTTTNIAGTTKGIMQFDIPTGVPVDGDLDTRMTMNINADGQSIPMTVDIKTKVVGKRS
jgi:hypothetical protein